MSKKKDVVIVERVRAALKECRGNWYRLDRLTGGRLSYRWLAMFANGGIKDPSFSKIELLGKYLGIKITTTTCGHYLKFTPE